MKKRIIAAVMATLVGLSMVGCGSTSSDNSSQNKTDNTDSTAQAETSDGEKNPVTIRFYNYALSETAKDYTISIPYSDGMILKKKTTGLILKQSQ